MYFIVYIIKSPYLIATSVELIKLIVFLDLVWKGYVCYMKVKLLDNVTITIKM